MNMQGQGKTSHWNKKRVKGTGVVSRLRAGPVRYSDALIEHALKIAKAEGNEAAAKATGIPWETIRKYARRGRREVNPVPESPD